MRFFGLELKKADNSILAPVDNRGSFWGGFGIREAFAGAWQRNIEIRHDSVLHNTTVFACITLIASDISKLCWKLQKLNPTTTIWEDGTSPAFSTIMDNPNRYQNHIQFKEQWFISKLTRGNTYALKERDNRNVVKALYILDPTRVVPLVDDQGNVYYQIATDNLTGISQDGIVVPASEIIHDRFNCLFHPLVGLSPIFACGLPAMLGQHALENSALFFKNGGMPSGILTAPGSISDETAKRMKDEWTANYTGKNAGKVAVLGDNLKFEKMVMTSVDAQVIEQLRFTDEKICSVYHVPQYKVGVGTQPTYNNIEALNQDYYGTCLQALIESFELCIDQGLALPDNISIIIDLDGLLRMDTSTLMTTITGGVKGTIMTPNEGRKKLNLAPVAGGDAVYSQQQNYSLEALAKRDAGPDPFVQTVPTKVPDPDAAGNPEPAPAAADDANKQALWNTKMLDAFELEMAQ